ncbi:hypothetical protein [Microbacterium sp. LWH3-1.2]|uniref:hypothetical protein n=1 Tax=Microbacterium sp. LWH3-1.2 TaxID=3135256 RepID=UPI003423BBB1
MVGHCHSTLRATLRISSQLLANGLAQGVIGVDPVDDSLRRLSSVVSVTCDVDQENSRAAGYTTDARIIAVQAAQLDAAGQAPAETATISSPARRPRTWSGPGATTRAPTSRQDMSRCSLGLLHVREEWAD